MIGRTIGNYVVRTKIGEGGMGSVFAADHPRIGRRVAIKVLHPELGKNPEIVARFFTEARAANEIRNEHIIEILDFGELPDGISYFIMEWLEGRSLSKALEEMPQFPAARALHVARGIARALTAAHDKGIVHRDLKPDNVFLLNRGDDPDFVKVLDFGIAKLMAGDPLQGFKTQTGAIMGTPYYMSPEQCRGSTRDIDHRTDIYALGCILYQMVTGRLPFNADGLGELLLQHMTKPPTAPTALDPSIPVELERVILRALEKEPARRFANIREMAAALGGAATSLSTPVVDLAQVGSPPAPPATVVTQTPKGGASAAEPAASAAGPARSVTAPLLSTTLGGAAAEAVKATQARRSRTSYLVGGGLVGLAVVGGLIIVRSRGHSAGLAPTRDHATAAATSAGPAGEPEKPPAVTPAPARIQLSIETEPPSAALELDGQTVSHTFEATAEKHRLVVTAPGYKKYDVDLHLDRDPRVPRVTLEAEATSGRRRGPSVHASHPATRATQPPSSPVAPPAPPPERPGQPRSPEAASQTKPARDPSGKAYQGKKAQPDTTYPGQ
jgi:serine/threonine-protein kinase